MDPLFNVHHFSTYDVYVYYDKYYIPPATPELPP